MKSAVEVKLASDGADVPRLTVKSITWKNYIQHFIYYDVSTPFSSGEMEVLILIPSTQHLAVNCQLHSGGPAL